MGVADIPCYFLPFSTNLAIVLSFSCFTLSVVRFMLRPISSSDSGESARPNHLVSISFSRSLDILETNSRFSSFVRSDRFFSEREFARSARMLALMNQTAYAMNLKPRCGSNLRAASSSPLLPAPISSSIDLPLFWYCLAKLTTKRRLQLYKSKKASSSPCLICSTSSFSCSTVSNGYTEASLINDSAG